MEIVIYEHPDNKDQYGNIPFITVDNVKIYDFHIKEGDNKIIVTGERRMVEYYKEREYHIHYLNRVIPEEIKYTFFLRRPYIQGYVYLKCKYKVEYISNNYTIYKTKEKIQKGDKWNEKH